MPASSAFRLRIGGVPDRNCVMPGAGSYALSKANCRAWPNQPVIGCRAWSCQRSATNRNAGAPGPPFRYL